MARIVRVDCTPTDYSARPRVPVWVADVVTRACDEFGAVVPTVVWRRSRTNSHSSGHCVRYGSRIVVTAGSRRDDQRLVLLHELAHYFARTRLDSGQRTMAHDDVFYRKMFDLVRWDGRLTWRYVLTREGRYRAQAITTAKALGIRGAGTIGAEARRFRAVRRPPRGWCPLPLGECRFTTVPNKRHTHYLGMNLSSVTGKWYEVTEPLRHPLAEKKAAGGGR